MLSYCVVFLLLFNIVYVLYKVSKKCTANLDLLYKAVLSIKPTSKENERAFSITKSFITEARNRPTHRSLNAIGFLKATLIKETEQVILFVCVNRCECHRKIDLFIAVFP